MTETERIDRWLADLLATLDVAAELAERGRDDFDSDLALPLAFEALSNRAGEFAKRLIAAEPSRFTEPVWAQAARNRDFVVHHYDRIDRDALWQTVTQSFPQLRTAAARHRPNSSPGHHPPLM
ncbi:MAG TPA: HepT-like ribonuclease domain-containing protein [Nakamurella sp.]